jgi:hypothetical protein
MTQFAVFARALRTMHEYDPLATATVPAARTLFIPFSLGVPAGMLGNPGAYHSAYATRLRAELDVHVRALLQDLLPGGHRYYVRGDLGQFGMLRANDDDDGPGCRVDFLAAPTAEERRGAKPGTATRARRVPQQEEEAAQAALARYGVFVNLSPYPVMAFANTPAADAFQIMPFEFALYNTEGAGAAQEGGPRFYVSTARSSPNRESGTEENPCASVPPAEFLGVGYFQMAFDVVEDEGPDTPVPDSQPLLRAVHLQIPPDAPAYCVAASGTEKIVHAGRVRVLAEASNPGLTRLFTGLFVPAACARWSVPSVLNFTTHVQKEMLYSPLAYARLKATNTGATEEIYPLGNTEQARMWPMIGFLFGGGVPFDQSVTRGRYKSKREYTLAEWTICKVTTTLEPEFNNREHTILADQPLSTHEKVELLAKMVADKAVLIRPASYLDSPVVLADARAADALLAPANLTADRQALHHWTIVAPPAEPEAQPPASQPQQEEEQQQQDYEGE